jgi:peroxiredoxin
MSASFGQSVPYLPFFESEKIEKPLADSRGKKVFFLFFLFVFTSTCFKKLFILRDNSSQYSITHTPFSGISTKLVFTPINLRISIKHCFSLLCSYSKIISAGYNIFHAFHMHVATRRSAFELLDNRIVGSLKTLPTPGNQFHNKA